MNMLFHVDNAIENLPAHALQHFSTGWALAMSIYTFAWMPTPFRSSHSFTSCEGEW